MKSQTHSDLVDRALALAEGGAVAAAYRLLEHAHAAGDGLAAATLAHWRLSGQIIRRDLALARELYGSAAAAGVDACAPIHIAMLASGAGGTERKWGEALALLQSRAAVDSWASRQCQLLKAMPLTQSGDPVLAPTPVSADSPAGIDTFDAFLTPDECAYLIERAAPLLQPSVVVHPRSGALVTDPVRTAKAAGFPFVLEDPVLHAINRRIAAATGTTYDCGEPLQVLRYDPGDEYKLHSDALPSGDNQRVMTFLVALNEDYLGGDTDFLRLNYHWRGRTGDGLRFDNVDANGAIDPAMWHSGTRVTQGTKYLLSKWIRRHPLDLSGPAGRPF